MEANTFDVGLFNQAKYLVAWKGQDSHEERKPKARWVASSNGFWEVALAFDIAPDSPPQAQREWVVELNDGIGVFEPLGKCSEVGAVDNPRWLIEYFLQAAVELVRSGVASW